MPTTLQIADELCEVRLEGDIDINCSGELQSTLVEALSKRCELHVNMSGLSSLDVTAMQLLWAAAREAEKRAITFKVLGGVPEGVRHAASEAGLADFLSLLGQKIDRSAV